MGFYVVFSHLVWRWVESTKVLGELREVVSASSADLASLPYPDLLPGYYVVGSGNTGVSPALAVMAAGYFSAIFLSSLLMKCPPPGHLPPGYSPPVTQAGAGASVHVDSLFRTPQFWLLFTTSHR